MAFKGSVKFGSKEFDLLHFSYSVHRDTDPKGRPSSVVLAGKISMTIESTDDTTVIESMKTQHKPVDGTVTILKEDEEAKMKEVKWETGYVVDYWEGVENVGTENMLIRFTVSAKKVTIGNADFDNNWPK